MDFEQWKELIKFFFAEFTKVAIGLMVVWFILQFFVDGLILRNLIG